MPERHDFISQSCDSDFRRPNDSPDSRIKRVQDRPRAPSKSPGTRRSRLFPHARPVDRPRYTRGPITVPCAPDAPSATQPASVRAGRRPAIVAGGSSQRSSAPRSDHVHRGSKRMLPGRGAAPDQAGVLAEAAQLVGVRAQVSCSTRHRSGPWSCATADAAGPRFASRVVGGASTRKIRLASTEFWMRACVLGHSCSWDRSGPGRRARPSGPTQSAAREQHG